jgi:hypothetical protein
MHLQPSGKPEHVQPEVGFYHRPRAHEHPVQIGLSSSTHIPASATIT